MLVFCAHGITLKTKDPHVDKTRILHRPLFNEEKKDETKKQIKKARTKDVINKTTHFTKIKRLNPIVPVQSFYLNFQLTPIQF